MKDLAHKLSEQLDINLDLLRNGLEPATEDVRVAFMKSTVYLFVAQQEVSFLKFLSETNEKDFLKAKSSLSVCRTIALVETFFLAILLLWLFLGG